MKKDKFLNIVTRNFHIYKASCTIFLLGLSAVLGILGNIFGMLYLVLSFLPVLAWGILFSNERENTDL
ncbi:hypothetical protein [Clostridium sp. CF012]|uniref:hypothetical protein n=1 Tax=Clostridium sp. CF012 TaxID=2843319 RepID=UPI001C0B8543|nr:hypothetical protein [Clostridium sp. CF012]MBU3146168.1 hypothetical protein [Clostridium sp. CF012]